MSFIKYIFFKARIPKASEPCSSRGGRAQGSARTRRSGGPPGDDTGHAVLAVAGAVDAQPGQEVEQVS